MINHRVVFSLSKKEFLSYINSSAGYILIVPFLLISYFLYFRSAFLLNYASLRPFFDFLPYILLLIAPAIAMRTFSQEQKNNTLELLFAHPISELEIVLAKFLGSLAFYSVLLLSSLSLPITTLIFSNPDPGVLIAQYLGALFVGGAFLSIGIAASSLTSTQVSSFLLAAAINFSLILIGFDTVLLALPKSLSAAITQTAILPHVANISRGVLDARDLLYFITLIGVFLAVSVIKLSQRRTAENPAAKNRLTVALGLIAAIGIVANILMYSYPLRLDLTFNRLFTISRGTRKVIDELPDIVTINLYNSTNLPGPVEANVRKVKDTLRDYHILGKGKIRLLERFPDTKEEDALLAAEDRIQEVQFNTLANNSFAVQKGYLGMSIYYGDEKESIPFIQNVDDLEYQLTRLIRKLSMTKKPSLAIFSPEESRYRSDKSIAFLREHLQMQYVLDDIELDNSETVITSDAVMVYGLEESLSSTASGLLKEYIAGGGKAILLLENHRVDPQAGTANPYNTGLEGVLSDYGITPNKDIVYDTRLNETITLNAGNMNYLMPYPFWIKALPSQDDFPLIRGINAVTLSWANSFELEEIEGVKHSRILQTSPNGGIQTGIYSISPNQLTTGTLTATNKEYLVAVAAEKAGSKLVVVGDSDFITDSFLQNTQQNIDFASVIIDWVISDELIASIKRNTGDSPIFKFTSSSQATTVQYLNLIGMPVLVIFFGVWYLGRRKRLTQRIYKD
jgi:ABC-2 type transport system permease protein